MRHLLNALVVGFSLATVVARAAHTEAQLLLAAEAAPSGTTVMAAVQLTMEPGWHTYWKNPGESGQATEIKWTLPPGVTAGEIQWPLPKIIPPAEIITFGYEDETLLLVPLTLDQTLPAGPLELAAKVSWLECKESCIPGSTTVRATLTVGGETKPSTHAALIATWQAKVPQATGPFITQAFWQEPAGGDTRTLVVEVDWPAPGAAGRHDRVDFFPNASEDFAVQSETKITKDVAGELVFTKPVKKFSGDWPREISGVLVLPQSAFEIKLNVADLAGNHTASVAANTSAIPPPALWQMLLFAFIGGLILNIMPCVLPVIALKILGFVNEARSDQAHVRKLGLVYTLGVLASFLALAALILGVKAAGHKAGWGMQFDSPIFLVCLTTLVTLVALNLFGLFEVTLGGGTLDKAGALASRPGAGGAFFNGVLATILATPCTAPILGSALGFAFTQPPAILTLIFLTVGAGLAAPYLVLSWNPAWLKFLPKPGAWMEKFKIAMGFPMLAAVVWLLSVASSTYGKNVVWLGVFLVFVAMAAWVFGEFFQRGRSYQTVALGVTLGLLGGGYAFALESQLDWRRPPVLTDKGPLKESPDGIDWRTWSPEAVAAARATNAVVLVDFTADWCLTCRLNKQTSLEVTDVRQKLKELHAVALLGDYTHFPDAITTELNHYNRAGVPLVLVYPRNRDLPPIILSEVLTKGDMLDALNRAGQ